MVFLVQMTQSNKCGSVRNDKIINLNLGSGAGPSVSIPCHLQDTSHTFTDFIHQKKPPKNPEMRSSYKQIISCCLDLRTQNPGLRKVDLEPSAKRGTNRTKALVSLYCLSQSLHLQQSPSQILHKSTKVNPIRSSST